MQGKDASHAMRQLLEEAIDLANAFSRREISMDQFTDSTRLDYTQTMTDKAFQNDVTSPGKKKRESSDQSTNKRRNVTEHPSFIYK